MALKAITQVSSPKLQHGTVKKFEQRPSAVQHTHWTTSTDADFSRSVAAEAREKALKARAAGGPGRTETLHDKAEAMIYCNSEPTRDVSLPMHLRSAFSGAGVVPMAAPDGGSSARCHSPRCSTPRCNSPRYLQATMASALRTRADDKVDVTSMRPAGGESNIATKYTMDLGSEAGQQPRRLRRALSAPRSRAKEIIFEPQYDRDCFGPGFGIPMPPQLKDGTSARRPTAEISSHDKSIPNSRRSQRGRGVFIPTPVLTSIEVLAASKDPVPPEAVFGPDEVKHRGRGLASPLKLHLSSDPNPAFEHGLANQQRSVEGAGVASILSVRDVLLNGRRAKGLCSPTTSRTGRSPYQWD
ncbi:hypothetical protein AB1Y20_018150 [Prymnesium parvum]|uniref:Uncharacterized protein n=1 Tax=Prymnesium parvum TaxID=97485 RepID=A0AB34JPU5_PRYPA